MRYIFSILFCVIIQTGFSQIVKTVGYSYTNGTPTYTPARAGSSLALDTVTWRYYTWNGSTWISDGFRIQTISGCAAPAYTPTKFQSYLVINACTAGQGGPEMYFWNGTAWLCLNCDTGTVYTEGTGIDITGTVITNTAIVDTIASYTALRLYAGESRVLYVQDFSYTFNSISYTTIGGLFRRVTSGTENGGTIITGVFKWARDWEGVRVQPEWWVVGGYDVNGTTSPTIFTENGIYNDCERIQAANDLIPNGGVLVLGAISRIYNCDKTLNIGPNVTVEGNGVTIKRANSPIATTTTAITTIGTTVTVSNITGYRVGQELICLDVTNSLGNSPFYGGYADTENSSAVGFNTYPKITGISGNIITYASPMSNNIGIGGVLQFKVVSFASISASASVINVNFDGNRSNGGQGYHFSYGWRSSSTIYFGANVDRETSSVQKCTFKNIPGECIEITRGLVSNCIADSLYGSFVHVGTSDADEVGVSVVFNQVRDVCLATAAVANHNEGAISLSQYPYNFRVANNLFRNGKEGVIGYGSKESVLMPESYNIQVHNNDCENFRSIIFMRYGPVSSLYRMDNFTITNNTFNKCGDIIFRGDFSNLKKGAGFYGINISGNKIFDGRIYMDAIRFANISNNQIIFNDSLGHKPFAGRILFSTLDLAVNMAAAVVWLSGSDIKFVNNDVQWGFNTYNDTVKYGVKINVEQYGVMKSSAGTDMDFYYSQNINILNNNVLGFVRGITSMPGNFGYGSLLKWAVGYNIKGNTVKMNIAPGSLPGYAWGITVPPGGVCTGNTVYQDTTSGIGIFLTGPTYSAIGTADNRVPGSIAYGNFVYGKQSTASIYVGDVNAANCNIICRDNFTDGGIFNWTPQYNYVANNTLLTTSLLPNLTAPLKPVFNYNGLNQNQY